jgi:ribosomal protein S18 acetylase RimI-like enzyme
MNAISNRELRMRQGESQRAFYRAMAGGSEGARLLTLEGIQATIVPAREWFSIFNSVFYRDPSDLERAHPTLAAEYEAAGVQAWTVWVPPDDKSAASILESRGHALDSTPMLFAAAVDHLDLESRIDLDLDRQPTWEVVCKINDQAHDVLEPWSMAAVFEKMTDPASHLHVARRDGVSVAALIAREHDGDCYFWFVATVPEAQRGGLASELMRYALREARGRGCTSTSLESTKVAEPMYGRLGYQPLGRYQMWERRSSG